MKTWTNDTHLEISLQVLHVHLLSCIWYQTYILSQSKNLSFSRNYHNEGHLPSYIKKILSFYNSNESNLKFSNKIVHPSFSNFELNGFLREQNPISQVPGFIVSQIFFLQVHKGAVMGSLDN